ncbi:hypothetical protein IZ6_12980 [Terrihabitans soli]|uniref:site-specific DNA-methyltransferase (cytosine-N(4)-specific) n=1 Tax=Terrihabitans soli TaxID=708113 RepID=A0A6S6QHB4_9HYPH|nr:site-specific DNA-methyltransferase [Terrihabitans soli]BCJ90563.1 hypothetical protein IZ6_12980 [Terrihabitans soli]
MTATIHPFPARMAPELALAALKNVPVGGTIIDPMMGSGTVIRHATELGLQAVGFDMDPLAVLMSRVWTTPVDDRVIGNAYARLSEIALGSNFDNEALPWIDADPETRDFINYWFGCQQIVALRRWSGAIAKLANELGPNDTAALDVVRVALSRIIVTKEQCASLARDTSHSRPHRVTLSSDYCIHQGLDRSLKIVRGRLQKSPPTAGAKIYRGDARAMPLADDSADAILTSPPYLNAIDYLRGHRMSLIWLGYRLSELRTIRSDNIGAERRPEAGAAVQIDVKASLGNLESLPRRHQGMVERYVCDIVALASEVKRLLRPGGTATMIVGNSTLKGVFIKNSAAVLKALELQGLRCVSESVRDLPSSSRYLPTAPGSKLANRMRQETVLTFVA